MASITYDLPGHGASARRPLDTVEAMADQLAAILAISGLRRAHVVGVSLGGLVAQHFAVRYPDRLDRLILVDTVACYPPAVQQQWKQRAATARSAGMAPLIEATLATWFTPRFLSANGPVVTAVRRMLAAADPDGYAITCEALASADTTAVASSISAPTLLVCGEHDLPPFRDAAGWFAAQILRSQVAWLPEVQHAGVLERSTAFITAVRSFLAEAS
jgi:pimeloyl-ACP methyl ester carboxylesterase